MSRNIVVFIVKRRIRFDPTDENPPTDVVGRFDNGLCHRRQNVFSERLDCNSSTQWLPIKNKCRNLTASIVQS